MPGVSRRVIFVLGLACSVALPTHDGADLDARLATLELGILPAVELAGHLAGPVPGEHINRKINVLWQGHPGTAACPPGIDADWRCCAVPSGAAAPMSGANGEIPDQGTIVWETCTPCGGGLCGYIGGKQYYASFKAKDVSCFDNFECASGTCTMYGSLRGRNGNCE